MLATKNSLMAATGAMFIALGAVGTRPVEASTLVFFNEADFLRSASNSLSLESFEGLPAIDVRASRDVVFENFITAPDFTIEAIPPELNGEFFGAIGVVTGPFEFGNYSTDGQNSLLYQSAFFSPVDDPPDPGFRILRFDFNTPINSFGINITDFGNYDGEALTFNNNAGESFVVARAPRPSFNQLFFGIISDEPFARVDLVNDKTESYGVDEIYYGVSTKDVPIPEPGYGPASTLGILALVALGRRLRLKRKQV